MNKILFIASGNSQTGFGHIARSLMLCKEFSLKGYNPEIAVTTDCPFTAAIEKDGIEVFKVPYFEDECLAVTDYDVIVIDTVEQDYEKLRWLSGAIREDALLVSITLFLFDVTRRYEHLSFFPDFQPDRQEQYNTATGTVTINIGKSYLTLRPEFSQVKNIDEDSRRDVLITMGGSDPEGFSLKSLQAIIESEMSITIIISEVAKTFTKVKELADKNARVKIVSHTNSIAEVMASHKIILLNGGLTRYEACAAGTPFIAIAIHDIQFEITQKITSHGVGINLGVGNRLSTDDIKSAVTGLLNDKTQRDMMRRNMQGLIPLNGTANIVNGIINYKEHAGTY